MSTVARETSIAGLRNAQRDRADAGIELPIAITASIAGTLVRAFVAVGVGAQMLSHLRLEDLLDHALDQLREGIWALQKVWH